MFQMARSALHAEHRVSECWYRPHRDQFVEASHESNRSFRTDNTRNRTNDMTPNMRCAATRQDIARDQVRERTTGKQRPVRQMPTLSRHDLSGLSVLQFL